MLILVPQTTIDTAALTKITFPAPTRLPFSFNFAKGCLGAGVRLGGHKVGSHQFGVYNNVYGNELAKVEEGALDVEFPDQGEICANVCDGNVCGVMG